MADNQDRVSKEEAKAAKAAAKAAEKERKERIKRNKPKADENRPNIFVRMWNAIKRFFKNFIGTSKKVIWPDAKTVLKSSGVVIVCVLIVGIGIWVVDWGLSSAVKASTQALAEIGEEKATDAAEDDNAENDEAVTSPEDNKEEGTTAA